MEDILIKFVDYVRHFPTLRVPKKKAVGSDFTFYVTESGCKYDIVLSVHTVSYTVVKILEQAPFRNI